VAAELALQVGWDHGVVVEGPRARLRLDPSRPGSGESVLSHAHLDHLSSNRAHMTPATREILAARIGAVDAVSMPMHAPRTLGGLEVTLLPAGHCLGAAMVQAGSVLYTGDFHPAAGLTTPAAQPAPCETLVMESTYGDPRFRLPPRELALASLAAWLERTLPDAGVALGAYQLGRAQELIALLNQQGSVPVVTPDIEALCDVYVRHGVPLRYRAATPDEMYGTLAPGQAIVVPRNLLVHGTSFPRHLRDAGAKAAYVSGWCGVFSYHDKYAIDAQFALTDHASFDQLLAFAAACEPRLVLTCMGRAESLAREITMRLGIPARALSG
jgi:putative mRNA 3-end processing factor